MNKMKKGSTAETYDYVSCTSIKMYFKYRFSGLNKSESSEKAAEDFWPNNSKAYRSKCIVIWAKEYLQQGELSKHCQGVHVKRQSLLSGAGIKEKIITILRTAKPAERSLPYIKKFIENHVYPITLGVTGTIAEATISKYLYEWGYSYRKNRKTIYFDGHERKDVVEYRKEWCERMVVEYMRSSDFYCGEQEEVIIEPESKEGEKK